MVREEGSTEDDDETTMVGYNDTIEKIMGDVGLETFVKINFYLRI